MRPAFTLLGIISALTFLGIYLAFRDTAPSLSDVAPIPMASALTLSSPAIKENGVIPRMYTCDGEGVSPELHIQNAPEGTKSFVIVMDDPDIPEAVKSRMHTESFDHWVLYNISANTTVIPEGMNVGTVGMSSIKKAEYIPPCPPDREHRYIFRLYALPSTLTFNQTPTLQEVEEAAKASMLASSTLMARYERETTSP